MLRPKRSVPSGVLNAGLVAGEYAAIVPVLEFMQCEFATLKSKKNCNMVVFNRRSSALRCDVPCADAPSRCANAPSLPPADADAVRSLVHASTLLGQEMKLFSRFKMWDDRFERSEGRGEYYVYHKA